MLRADFGCPSSTAAPLLRRSAFFLGQLGAGDAVRLVLLARKWETAETLPTSAELDRQLVNAQIAELLPGWFE